MQGQYNLRNPAVKRLMKEAQELSEPTEQFYAQPLEDNLFEWHFTIRGPADSEFDGGLYHGRIVLPPEYPMKPPSILLLTPNGRFEIFKKICLSISGHHPESWRPSWSIRTAMLAIIGFMPSHGNGAIGSLDYTPEERKVLAKRSLEWKCQDCGALTSILKPVTAASKKETDEAKELAQQINFQGEKEKKSTSDATSAPSSPAATATETLPPSPFPGFNPQMFGGFPMMPGANPFVPGNNTDEQGNSWPNNAMIWPPSGSYMNFPNQNTSGNSNSDNTMPASWQDMMLLWQQNMSNVVPQPVDGANSAVKETPVTAEVGTSSSSLQSPGKEDGSRSSVPPPMQDKTPPSEASQSEALISPETTVTTTTTERSLTSSPTQPGTELRHRGATSNSAATTTTTGSGRATEDLLPVEVGGSDSRQRDNPYMLLTMALLSLSIAVLLLRRLYTTIQNQYDL